jgi:hypothetical protein
MSNDAQCDPLASICDPSLWDRVRLASRHSVNDHHLHTTIDAGVLHISPVHSCFSEEGVVQASRCLVP